MCIGGFTRDQTGVCLTIVNQAVNNVYWSRWLYVPNRLIDSLPYTANASVRTVTKKGVPSRTASARRMLGPSMAWVALSATRTSVCFGIREKGYIYRFHCVGRARISRHDKCGRKRRNATIFSDCLVALSLLTVNREIVNEFIPVPR